MIKPSRKQVTFFFRLLVPLVFFGVVFQVISLSDIARVLKNADSMWFAAGCASVLVTNWLCSQRTRTLLYENAPPLLTLWHIHALRALITGALPFSAGELSYVYYLRKYCVTPAARGLALLVSIRFLEFAMFLCLLFILASAAIFLDPSMLNWIAFSIIGCGMAMVFFALWQTSFLLNTMSRFLDFVSKPFVSKDVADIFLQRVECFSQSVRQVFVSEKKTQIALQTLCIVILRNAFVLSMVAAMGVAISAGFVVFLFILLFVTRFIQGFGSFGNQEIGIAGALMLLGYPRENALVIAVGTHLLQWIPVLILGGISYFGIQRSKADRPAS
jgi:uncharacterized membrane protein YbhN (UPF0104 family)